MSLSKQNIQILIGLVMMGLSLSTCLFSYRNQTPFLGFSRTLQVFATAIMIFGILKAHPAHKAKMLLIWLSISSLFCSALINVAIEYMADFNFRYFRLGNLLTFILPLLVAAGVAYMMNFIYKGYAELAQVAEQPQELKHLPPHESNIQKLTRQKH